MLSQKFKKVLKIIAKKLLKLKGCQWAVIGSAGLALQGVKIKPHDLDLLMSFSNLEKMPLIFSPYQPSAVLKISFLNRLPTRKVKMKIRGIKVEICAEPKDGVFLSQLLARKIKKARVDKIEVPCLNLQASALAYAQIERFKRVKLIKKFLKQPIKVAVSGGFDPVHFGHLRLFKAAKKLGDQLIVILNNDHWLLEKKGFVFMLQKERQEILKAIKWVDRVVLTSHPKNPKDMSVCRELKKIKPDIFANGGDRTRKNIPEKETCKKIGCQMVFNVGGGKKIQSSSWLLEQYEKCCQK